MQYEMCRKELQCVENPPGAEVDSNTGTEQFMEQTWPSAHPACSWWMAGHHSGCLDRYLSSAARCTDVRAGRRSHTSQTPLIQPLTRRAELTESWTRQKHIQLHWNCSETTAAPQTESVLVFCCHQLELQPLAVNLVTSSTTVLIMDQSV